MEERTFAFSSVEELHFLTEGLDCPWCRNERKATADHLANRHLRYAIYYQDGDIEKFSLPCFCACGRDPKRSHWHCAKCLKTLSRSTQYKVHLKLHGYVLIEKFTEGIHDDTPTMHELLPSERHLEGNVCDADFSPFLSDRKEKQEEQQEKQQQQDEERQPMFCVDASNGIYVTPRDDVGPRTPIHVCKSMVSQTIACELEACKSFMAITADSGNPGKECRHLERTCHSIPYIRPLQLFPESLERMVDKGLLTKPQQEECQKVYNKALLKGTDSVFPIFWGVHGIFQRFADFSVYTDKNDSWCMFGRTLVTLDSQTGEWTCLCNGSKNTKYCVHKLLSVWWLFQEFPVLLRNVMDVHLDDIEDVDDTTVEMEDLKQEYTNSDTLELRVFKHGPSSLSRENVNKIQPFHYVLCTATTPASKLCDETLTYLNQGQSYEIRLLSNRQKRELPEITGMMIKSIIRVILDDQCLLESWNRPSERLVDIDVSSSSGITDPRAPPSQLNSIEFLWDPSRKTSAFIQVHCITQELSPQKHGGEKGRPFRLQIDTFGESNYKEFTEHLHSASCLIKVFKSKGAERKLKMDLERMEKISQHEKKKYQQSYEVTILTECSPWPEINNSKDYPSSSYKSTHDNFPAVESIISSHVLEPVVQMADSCHSLRGEHESSQHLLPNATPQEAQQWLAENRFSAFSQLFVNYSGADLLKLTREDVIQICGPADGIRLFNLLKGRGVRPRLTLYVSHAESQQEQQRSPEVGDTETVMFVVYHPIFLEDLRVHRLTTQIAQLLNMSPQKIFHIYKQGLSGLHVRVNDEMLQNFQDESYYTLETVKATAAGACHIILK